MGNHQNSWVGRSGTMQTEQVLMFHDGWVGSQASVVPSIPCSAELTPSVLLLCNFSSPAWSVRHLRQFCLGHPWERNKGKLFIIKGKGVGCRVPYFQARKNQARQLFNRFCVFVRKLQSLMEHGGVASLIGLIFSSGARLVK
jgi:hypothetical protein